MLKCAIVLCSGGIDSVTTAYYVKKKLSYDELVILFFDYSQQSLIHERQCSIKCAQALDAFFHEIKLPELGKLSFSLINKEGYVKKLSPEEISDTQAEGARFYVPARNTIFLSYALALSESLAHIQPEKGVPDIFIGFKNEGAESFPDTTQEFLNRINALASIGCMQPSQVHAPLIAHDKEEIIVLASELSIDLLKTWSCYQASHLHCGTCLACRLRQAGFKWAGITDPTPYISP